MMLSGILALTAVFGATPDLLPPAQKCDTREGSLVLPADVVVQAPAAWSGRVGSYLWLIDEVLKGRGEHRVSLGTAGAVVTVSESTDASLPREGYVLEVTDTRIAIQARGTGGAFNALATLAQLIEQSPSNGTQGSKGRVAVPACRIVDWPALPDRVVHIDMTLQQYTGSYVRKLMRMLARYKVNVILMEYADMFPFRRHSGICRPEALTEQDLAEICRTAEACNQEIIPHLQCLGHLEYVLHKPAYAQYGINHRRYMLCPSSEEAIPLVRELIDEIVEQHPGLRRLHVGGDEVDQRWGGDCSRCAPYLKEHGFSALYVKHFKLVAEYCRGKGVQPLLWSDMMVKYPDAIDGLPRNIGFVVWDYQVTTDPTGSESHGVSMATLDKVSPAYRKYFGEAVGLEGAKQRGGLVAFGHAAAFKTAGFEAFPSPAVRSAGDNFDLPRFDLHMKNTRVAFLKAADFKLPGAFVTSWSDRGSPHEVCLPEYACVAYGWNTASPEVGKLMSLFLRERYGIDDATLSAALLATSPIIPPSAMAMPQLDDTWRAWVMNGRQELQQIREAARGDAEQVLATCRGWLGQMTATAQAWHAASAKATRNRTETRCWDLSMQHLIHRLRMVDPLVRLAGVVYAGVAATDDQVAGWKQELCEFDEPRDRLRQAWADLYCNVHTPSHLKVELYNRFDAEREMIDLLLADVARKRPGAASRP